MQRPLLAWELSPLGLVRFEDAKVAVQEGYGP